nr:MAG TPA: hypothetical protein [Caudoviricetes sp.]
MIKLSYGTHLRARSKRKMGCILYPILYCPYTAHISVLRRFTA